MIQQHFGHSEPIYLWLKFDGERLPIECGTMHNLPLSVPSKILQATSKLGTRQRMNFLPVVKVTYDPANWWHVQLAALSYRKIIHIAMGSHRLSEADGRKLSSTSVSPPEPFSTARQATCFVTSGRGSDSSAMLSLHKVSSSSLSEDIERRSVGARTT